MLFEYVEDAQRVMSVLRKRFGKYGLQLHPEKTRLLNFKRPRRVQTARVLKKAPGMPGTFDFLGFLSPRPPGQKPDDRLADGEDSNSKRPFS